MNRTVLNRRERDLLHDEVMLDFTSLGDITVTIKNGNCAEAQGLRQRFEDDFRLLDDIGWNPLDGRDSYTLTMPPEQRERLFRRILDGVDGCLRDFSPELSPNVPPEAIEEEKRIIEQHRRLVDRDLELWPICVAVLGGV
ncbi:MAG: hypothetical protein JW940_18760 [Polyangiaceae bacterium]|nr:hypothetical protein [Polyangiaceae bacterium]